jgi:hypothetical protein
MTQETENTETQKNEIMATQKNEIMATKIQETGVAPYQYENIDAPCGPEDFEVPRVKLLQLTSPECAQGGSVLRPGLFINSITLELMPDVFIPIFRFVQWIRFNPKNNEDPRFDPDYEPGEIIWKSRDRDDPRVKKEGVFGPKGEKPLATKFLNFFSWFPGTPGPLVVGFCNTSYRAGRRFNSMYSQILRGGEFTRKFELQSYQKENKKGIFYIMKVIPSGFSSSDEVARCREYHTKFRDIAHAMAVDVESQDAEFGPEESGGHDKWEE